MNVLSAAIPTKHPHTARGLVPLLRMVLLLAVCCSSGVAVAHLPEPYGRDFVPEPPGDELTEAPAEEAPPEEPVPDGDAEPAAGDSSALDRARLLAELEAALKELEEVTGPYASDLSDPLTQLGELYDADGNPVEAMRRYERALHLLRVNNGLLHPAQLPIVRKLAPLYQQIGDWDSAQRAWRYAYRIHGLGQKPLTDEGIKDALAYFQYARDRFIAPGSQRDLRLFLEAYRDNRMLWESLLDKEDSDSSDLNAVGMSNLHNLYIMVGTDLSGGAMPMGDMGSASHDRMLNLQLLAVGFGLDILDELAEARAGDGIEVQARLLLERANWQQWNNKWRSAREDYLRLHALLTSAPGLQELKEYLALPNLLPEDPRLWEVLQGPQIPTRGVVSASYTVSVKGTASEIETRVIGVEGSTLGGRLRKLLSASHYRPALFDGAVQVGRVVDRHYRLID